MKLLSSLVLVTMFALTGCAHHSKKDCSKGKECKSSKCESKACDLKKKSDKKACCKK